MVVCDLNQILVEGAGCIWVNHKPLITYWWFVTWTRYRWKELVVSGSITSLWSRIGGLWLEPDTGGRSWLYLGQSQAFDHVVVVCDLNQILVEGAGCIWVNHKPLITYWWFVTWTRYRWKVLVVSGSITSLWSRIGGLWLEPDTGGRSWLYLGQSQAFDHILVVCDLNQILVEGAGCIWVNHKPLITYWWFVTWTRYWWKELVVSGSITSLWSRIGGLWLEPDIGGRSWLYLGQSQAFDHVLVVCDLNQILVEGAGCIWVNHKPLITYWWFVTWTRYWWKDLVVSGSITSLWSRIGGLWLEPDTGGRIWLYLGQSQAFDHIVVVCDLNQILVEGAGCIWVNHKPLITYWWFVTWTRYWWKDLVVSGSITSLWSRIGGLWLEPDTSGRSWLYLGQSQAFDHVVVVCDLNQILVEGAGCIWVNHKPLITYWWFVTWTRYWWKDLVVSGSITSLWSRIGGLWLEPDTGERIWLYLVQSQAFDHVLVVCDLNQILVKGSGCIWFNHKPLITYWWFVTWTRYRWKELVVSGSITSLWSHIGGLWLEPDTGGRSWLYLGQSQAFDHVLVVCDLNQIPVEGAGCIWVNHKPLITYWWFVTWTRYWWKELVVSGSITSLWPRSGGLWLEPDTSGRSWLYLGQSQAFDHVMVVCDLKQILVEGAGCIWVNHKPLITYWWFVTWTRYRWKELVVSGSITSLWSRIGGLWLEPDTGGRSWLYLGQSQAFDHVVVVCDLNQILVEGAGCIWVNHKPLITYWWFVTWTRYRWKVLVVSGSITSLWSRIGGLWLEPDTGGRSWLYLGQSQAFDHILVVCDLNQILVEGAGCIWFNHKPLITYWWFVTWTRYRWKELVVSGSITSLWSRIGGLWLEPDIGGRSWLYLGQSQAFDHVLVVCDLNQILVEGAGCIWVNHKPLITYWWFVTWTRYWWKDLVVSGSITSLWSRIGGLWLEPDTGGRIWLYLGQSQAFDHIEVVCDLNQILVEGAGCIWVNHKPLITYWWFVTWTRYWWKDLVVSGSITSLWSRIGGLWLEPDTSGRSWLYLGQSQAFDHVLVVCDLNQILVEGAGCIWVNHKPLITYWWFVTWTRYWWKDLVVSGSITSLWSRIGGLWLEPDTGGRSWLYLGQSQAFDHVLVVCDLNQILVEGAGCIWVNHKPLITY